MLSLNLPLNPKTRHIISTEQLKLTKPSAIIVNTARGAVIDEAALVRALEQGVVAGAGLDVFEEESKVHSGLVRNDKVILLPHMEVWTSETTKKMGEWAIENVRMAVEEGKLVSPIFEQRELR